MKTWLVLIERTTTGYSAYAPDVPGCVAVGGTIDDVQHNMRAALASHLEMLRDDGAEVPDPLTQAAFVQV
jgi:predicted RNase H-like HicB family nuclease